MLTLLLIAAGVLAGIALVLHLDERRRRQPQIVDEQGLAEQIRCRADALRSLNLHLETHRMDADQPAFLTARRHLHADETALSALAAALDRGEISTHRALAETNTVCVRARAEHRVLAVRPLVLADA